MAKFYCDGAGVRDHGGPWRTSEQEPATKDGGCPRCATAAVEYLFGIRVDDAENIGMDRADARTRGINLGLPQVKTVVGVRPDGSKIVHSRPVTSAELSSNAKLRAYARRHGLTPADEGRYRSR